MEMMNFENLFEKMASANKQLVDSTIKLNEIAARAQGRFMRQQLAAVETYVEAGKKQMKLASEPRDPKDAMALGGELTMELGEAMTTMFRETVEMQNEVQGELQSWFQDGWKAVADKPAAPAKKKTG